YQQPNFPRVVMTTGKERKSPSAVEAPLKKALFSPKPWEECKDYMDGKKALNAPKLPKHRKARRPNPGTTKENSGDSEVLEKLISKGAQQRRVKLPQHIPKKAKTNKPARKSKRADTDSSEILDHPIPFPQNQQMPIPSNCELMAMVDIPQKQACSIKKKWNQRSSTFSRKEPTTTCLTGKCYEAMEVDNPHPEWK
ncbi:1738_t:CDS:2, partial [Paraglomus brasilianum]